MSGFDHRWRLLVRAASRAGEAPVPDAPDGARLQRRAAAEPAARPWRHAWRNGLAIAFLWTVAVPMAPSAWRGVHHALTRLAESAPAPACCGVSSYPIFPSTSTAPALVLPQPPPLPDFLPRLRWADPPTEAPPKETPS